MNYNCDIPPYCLYCRDTINPNISLNCHFCYQFLHPSCHWVPKQDLKVLNSSKNYLYCHFCKPIVDRLNDFDQPFINVESNVKSLFKSCEKLADNFESVSLHLNTLESNGIPSTSCCPVATTSSSDLTSIIRETIEIDSKKRNALLRNFPFPNSSSEDSIFSSVCRFSERASYPSNLITNAVVIRSRPDINREHSQPCVSFLSVKAHQMFIKSINEYILLLNRQGLEPV